MQYPEILLHSEEEILREVERIRTAYVLKRTLRYAGTRDPCEHGESVAEHVFALYFLAHYFLSLEDREGALDRTLVFELITFHDFGEIIDGDIPYHVKTDVDRGKEAENFAMVCSMLPRHLRRLVEMRGREYEEKKTPEARFVYALDKLEPVFELWDPVSRKALKKLGFTYEDHVEVKRKALADYPYMRTFMEVTTHQMRMKGYFAESR